MNKRIYIVEDEAIIARETKRTLLQLGFQPVGVASNYDDAIRGIQEAQPDLVLIGIPLKGSRSGIDIAKTLNQTRPIPIIFLTSVIDERTMLDAIATEPVSYLLKPLRRTELHSAILLALHSRPTTQPTIDLEDGYRYAPDQQTLFFNTQPVRLSPNERRLIHTLADAKGKIVPLDLLEETIWKNLPTANSSLRTLIYRLHKKLGCKIIETTPAIGCRLRLEEDAPKNI
jgi:DNA-binding response OmpR family regulator